MKKRIALILILMTVCVSGIIGLQLYWNFQNYKSTVKAFNHNINEALNTAVNNEIDQRQQKIVNRFKGWLADTAFIQITCDTSNRHGHTVFHMVDTHPLSKDEKGVYLGITKFKAKLNKITPAAKRIFIDHFGNNILKEDLKKGVVYSYTQRLGDSLLAVYEKSKLNMKALPKMYEQELLAKDIKTNFKLNPRNNDEQKLHLTKQVNTALRRPYEKEMVYAGFKSPDDYFIKEMKWLIITSLLLIAITLFCFAYTTKALLSQHKLSELKNTFINNMTHELNTPLASIKITVEALNSFSHDPQRLKEYLTIIGYQTDKLTDLTTQILNTNRLIKMKKENWKFINLVYLIGEAVQAFKPQFNHSNAIVVDELPDKDLTIKGDPSSLLNVFTNIINNALKYNTSPEPKLNVSIQATDKYVEIVFADNGPGIPAEYRSKIFDQFFRVPQGDRHDVKGYGLGLSYAKQVIDSHKGSIYVLPNRLQGSIFTVKLPLYS